MLEHLTHDALTLIVSKEKPIRGRARKEYPYANRNQAIWKDFFQNKDESYTIRYNKEEILKIHKGNILEVVKDYFCQGTKTVLNNYHKRNCEHKEIRHSKIHGGLIYESFRRDKIDRMYSPSVYPIDKSTQIILPLRVGMRFNMLTDTVAKGYEYDVIARKLNRKKSIKLLEEKESLFLRNKVMMNTIPPINIIKDIQKVLDEKGYEYEEMNENVDESYKQGDIYNLVINLIAKEENLVNYNGLRWGSAEQITAGYNPVGADDILKWSTNCLKEYLKEKYNLYDVTKKQPCEDRYFTSNKKIKFIMRGNNNEV
jgi:hypothetical protein